MSNEPFIIERTYQAPVEKVWKALTDKDQMKQWYFDIADFKPEVGFEFSFTAGTKERSYIHLCKIIEVIPGQKLTYSWRYDGYEGDSFVTFELFTEEEKTRLKLTHEGLESFPLHPDFAKSSFSSGWNSIIGSSLKNYVETTTITKSVAINASPAKIWDVIINPATSRQWASAFSEGAYVETDWLEGSDVTWKDNDGNVGAKGVVEVHEPASLLRISYEEETEIAGDPPTTAYSETYSVTEENLQTRLIIQAGPLRVKDSDMHTPMWNSALEKIKYLAEKGDE